MTIRRRSRLARLAVALIAALAAVLAGCGPTPPQELTYTLVESGSSDVWASDGPGLLAVASAGDIATVAPYLSPQAAATLETLDYAHEFALLILRGRDDRIPAREPIRRIVWWGNVVTVQMQLGEEAAAAPAGSPYTLVRVEKGPHWGGAHTLRLVTPGAAENILTSVRSIP
ncbi:MAG: hypothetical protein IT329_09175 [Caldilineaceae bacterium]|nr:hypothetical protein [Caldilineaceae bacterium]